MDAAVIGSTDPALAPAINLSAQLQEAVLQVKIRAETAVQVASETGKDQEAPEKPKEGREARPPEKTEEELKQEEEAKEAARVQRIKEKKARTHQLRKSAVLKAEIARTLKQREDNRIKNEKTIRISKLKNEEAERVQEELEREEAARLEAEREAIVEEARRKEEAIRVAEEEKKRRAEEFKKIRQAQEAAAEAEKKRRAEAFKKIRQAQEAKISTLEETRKKAHRPSLRWRKQKSDKESVPIQSEEDHAKKEQIQTENEQAKQIQQDQMTKMDQTASSDISRPPKSPRKSFRKDSAGERRSPIAPMERRLSDSTSGRSLRKSINKPPLDDSNSDDGFETASMKSDEDHDKKEQIKTEQQRKLEQVKNEQAKKDKEAAIQAKKDQAKKEQAQMVQARKEQIQQEQTTKMGQTGSSETSLSPRPPRRASRRGSAGDKANVDWKAQLALQAARSPLLSPGRSPMERRLSNGNSGRSLRKSINKLPLDDSNHDDDGKGEKRVETVEKLNMGSQPPFRSPKSPHRRPVNGRLQGKPVNLLDLEDDGQQPDEEYIEEIVQSEEEYFEESIDDLDYLMYEEEEILFEGSEHSIDSNFEEDEVLSDDNYFEVSVHSIAKLDPVVEEDWEEQSANSFSHSPGSQDGGKKGIGAVLYGKRSSLKHNEQYQAVHDGTLSDSLSSLEASGHKMDAEKQEETSNRSNRKSVRWSGGGDKLEHTISGQPASETKSQTTSLLTIDKKPAVWGDSGLQRHKSAEEGKARSKLVSASKRSGSLREIRDSLRNGNSSPRPSIATTLTRAQIKEEMERIKNEMMQLQKALETRNSIANLSVSTDKDTNDERATKTTTKQDHTHAHVTGKPRVQEKPSVAPAHPTTETSTMGLANASRGKNNKIVATKNPPTNNSNSLRTTKEPSDNIHNKTFSNGPVPTKSSTDPPQTDKQDNRRHHQSVPKKGPETKPLVSAIKPGGGKNAGTKDVTKKTPSTRPVYKNLPRPPSGDLSKFVISDSTTSSIGVVTKPALDAGVKKVNKNSPKVEIPSGQSKKLDKKTKKDQKEQAKNAPRGRGSFFFGRKKKK